MIHEYILNAEDGTKIGSLEQHSLSGRGLLAHLWVHPDYRGQKLARRLLSRAAVDADKNGTVLEGDPWGLQDVIDKKASPGAEAIYRSAGFVPEDNRVGPVRWIRQSQLQGLSAVHASVKLAEDFSWADAASGQPSKMGYPAPFGVGAEDHDKLQNELDYEYNPVFKDYFKEIPGTGRAHVLSPNGDGTWKHRVRLTDQDHRPVWFEAPMANLDDTLYSAKLINMDREPYSGKAPGSGGYTKVAAVSPVVKSYLPWADMVGLSPAQTAFQRTHPVVRRQILQGLVNSGRHQDYLALAGVHQAQSQVDRLRSYEGRPSPYVHPSRPQPWHTGNPTDQTRAMPRVPRSIAAAFWDGDPNDDQEEAHEREQRRWDDLFNDVGEDYEEVGRRRDEEARQEYDKPEFSGATWRKPYPNTDADIPGFGLGGHPGDTGWENWQVGPKRIKQTKPVIGEDAETISHELGVPRRSLSAVEPGGSYTINHRAPTDGPTMDNPEDAGLPDVYDHPEYYVQPRDPRDPLVHRSGMENWRAVKAARGNPDAMVQIYRAVPHGVTSIDGHTSPSGASWVSASPSYAKRHALAESCSSCGGDMQVVSGLARAGDLHNEGYLEEWGYTGDPIRDTSALTECPEGAFEKRKADTEEFMRRQGAAVRSKPIFDAEMGGPSGKLQKLVDNMNEVDPDPHLSDFYGDHQWDKDYQRLVGGRHGFQGGYEVELDEGGGVSYHRGGQWTNHLGKRIPVAHVIKPVLAVNPDKMVGSDPRQEVQYLGVSSIPGDEGDLYRTLQEAASRPSSLGNRWNHPGRGYEPRPLSQGFKGQMGRGRVASVDESGLKAAGIAVIALDTGRVLMQQRALNPLHCPCGMGVTWDEMNGYQHDDGSVSHDGEFYGQSVSDLLDQGHPEPLLCPCCLGRGDNEEGSECASCDGSGVDAESPSCDPPCQEIEGLDKEAAQDDYDRVLHVQSDGQCVPFGVETGEGEKEAREHFHHEYGSAASIDDIHDQWSHPEDVPWPGGWEGGDDAFSRTAALEYDPNEGTWEFPGGKLDPGELARAAAVREFREEVGQDLPPGVFVGAWVSPGGFVVTAAPGWVDPAYQKEFHEYLDHEVGYSPEDFATMPPSEQRSLADGFGRYIGEDHPRDARYHLDVGGAGHQKVRMGTPGRTVRVLRVEKLDGTGPFAYGGATIPRPYGEDHPDGLYSLLNPYEEDDPDRGSVKQRQPYADGIPARYVRGRSFGFLPQHDVSTYFSPKMLGGLHDMGYGMSEYDVPGESLVLGRTQVAWRPEDATRVSHTPLAEHRGLGKSSSRFIEPFGDAEEFTALGWTPVRGGKTNEFEKGNWQTPYHHNAWYDRDEDSPTGYSWRLNSFGDGEMIGGGVEGDWGESTHPSPHEVDEKAKDRENSYIADSLTKGKFVPAMSQPRPVMLPSEDDRNDAWGEDSTRSRLDKAKPLADLPTSHWMHPLNPQRLSGFTPAKPGETPGQVEPDDARPKPIRLGAVRKAPVYKGFIYLIQRERDIDLSQREIHNPDDPDGDMTEQSAWWDIEHARKNPALRAEVKKGTPWAELEIWADKSVRNNKEIKESFARLAKAENCMYCKTPATKEIVHSEGMGRIPVCAEHLGKGKTDAAACVPYGDPDPSNIDSIREASAKTAMPLTQDVPKVNQVIRTGEPSVRGSTYSEARVDDVSMPSGDWIRKLPQYRHLIHEEYQTDPGDVPYFLDQAGTEADLEEFAGRLGHALSNPSEEPIAPVALRGHKSTDLSPAVYVQKYPDFADLKGTPGADEHVDTPRGKLMGYFHSVLGEGDHVDHHNMGVTAGVPVSVDHGKASLPLYAEALAGKDPGEMASMRWHHEFGMSPYESHFLVEGRGGWPTPKEGNPLAHGDTERALGASETLRPWAKDRGREDWLDAAQHRMRMLGQRAGGTGSMFPYQMAHEQSLQATAASTIPPRGTYPAIRDLVKAGRPHFSIRTPAEVAGEHHDMILDSKYPTYHEERDAAPDTPKVYARRSAPAKSTVFLVPLRHDQTGQTGWLGGRTDQQPREWQLYRDSEIADAVAGRKPDRSGKAPRVQAPQGASADRNRYGEQAAQRYTRGYARGTAAPGDVVDRMHTIKQHGDELQEGDVPLDEEGHQIIEPRRDLWVEPEGRYPWDFNWEEGSDHPLAQHENEWWKRAEALYV